MLKQGYILQTMNQIDDCLNEKNKKVSRLMKDELGGKIVTKFTGLEAKTFSYLIDVMKIKKAKSTKKWAKKESLNLIVMKTVLKQLNLRTK